MKSHIIQTFRFVGIIVILNIIFSYIDIASAAEKGQWGGFVPPTDEIHDWMQLTSGEWLKGELIYLYDFSVEFDSDELGLLSIDWEDIRYIRSARVLSIRIENSDNNVVNIFGVLQLSENTAELTSYNMVHKFNREHIISIASGADSEILHWTGEIAFGANVFSGNTDSTNVNLFVKTERLSAVSRFHADYTANISSTGNVEIADNHRFTSYYDIFINRELFWRTYTTEYYRDAFKNIDHQISLATSYGYDLIRTTKSEWEISGSVGAIYKQFLSVEAGNDIDDVSPSLGVGTKLDTALSKNLDYLLDYSFQIVNTAAGRYTQHLKTTLSSDIVGDLDLDISFVWDRIWEPQSAADGSIPDSDDFQTIVNVSYEF